MAKLGEGDLHDYQQDTVEHLYERDRRIAVLVMGGGKTVSTLTTLKEWLEDGVIDCAWVLAPKRVALDVWPGEPAIWEHLEHLRISPVIGTPKQRQRALDAEADIYVMNYENIPWLRAEIGTFPPRTAIVFDEITRLKNPQGQRAKALLKMLGSVQQRIGLTGTPRPKDALDYFMMAQVIVGPALWGNSFWKWKKKHFFPTDYNGYNWEPKDPERLEREFASICFRIDEERLKKAMVKAHPIIHDIRLPARVQKMHNDALREWILSAGLEEDAEVLGSAAIGSIKARQIASGFYYDDAGLPHDVHDEKIATLLEIVEDAAEPVLIAYQFIHEVARLRDALPGLEVFGKGDAADSDLIERWNRGEVAGLAIHPASAGHGLNLQHGGRRLIWMSMPWSLEEYQQTNARLARQGQRRQVFIHHLIAAGTVDEAVLERQEQRDTAQRALIDLIRAVS